MRSVACSVTVSCLIAWQAAACWAIGPSGFSDPPPSPSDAPQGQIIQGQTTQTFVETDSASMPPTGTSTFAPEADGTGSPCCSGGCQSCRRHKLGCCIGIFCNMPQHYAYPSPWDRYYYFRPYQYFQVTQLQETVASWGQDPRNISDNSFFQQIYDQVDANSKQQPPAKAAPAPKPEAVPAPAPAPAKADVQGFRQGPKLDEPPLKFTLQVGPKRTAPHAARPATTQPSRMSAARSGSTTAEIRAPQSNADNGSQVELIRFVAP